MLLICRIVTGVGEASFAGIAPTLIDDVAPTAKRGIWLSVFFSTIPIGSALGYIAGGMLSGSILTWRASFVMESLLMIPFAVIFLICPMAMKNKLSNFQVNASASSVFDEKPIAPSFWKSLRIVCSNVVFLTCVFGYCFYMFVFGGLSAFLPDYLNDIGFARSMRTAGIGGATAVCGLLGTFIAGISLDLLGGTKGYAGVSRCFKVAIFALFRLRVEPDCAAVHHRCCQRIAVPGRFVARA